MKPYYQHAGITIYYGDCREVLLNLHADAVITDMPYGTGWVRGGGGVGEFNAKHERPEWDVFDVSWMDLSTAKKWAVFCPVSRYMDVARKLSSPTCLYWQKTNPRPLGPTREAIAVSPIPYNMLDWEWSAYNGDSSYHPCQKPIEVMVWLIAGVTEQDDLICDPFMGSGTTIRVAKDLGRRAIGIEIEEKYCEIAAKRLSQEVLEFK